jgi:hypothetical protein
MSAATAPATPKVDPETVQDRRSALPAGLAALAEAAYLSLPVHLLAVDSANVNGGPFTSPWSFALIVAGPVVVLTRLRRFRAGVTVAAAAFVALGVAQAKLWGHTDLAGTVATVAIALVVGFRVVALSLRDWRNPMRESFALGAFALLLEAAFAGNHPEFQGIMPPLILLFFLGGLGSRAASVRLARPVPVDPSPEEAATGRRWSRATLVVLGTLGALLVVSVALGGKNGGIAAIGHVVLTAVGSVLAFVVLLFARLILGPLNAILGRLHVDLRAFRQLADALNQFGENSPKVAGGGANLVERLLGLAVLVGLALLLVRAMRRHFALLDRQGADVTGAPAPEPSPLGRRGRFGRRRSIVRRELPADTVRRWYAEALLMLQRRGLEKPPAGTPAEFLVDVRAAYPECGAEFAVLTRAYEEVRYGSRTFEASALDRLEAHRVQLMGALHRARKLEPAEEGGS